MSKSTSNKAESEPWKPAQGDLRAVMRDARRMYRQGELAPDVYQGERVAGFSPEMLAALQSAESTIPFQQTGMDYITSTLDDAGMYRDFDRIKGIVEDDVKAALGSTFSGGTINSSLAGDTYTRALGDALAGVEFDAYNAGKDRQIAALGMMPSIAGVSKPAMVGGAMRDDLAQRKINADAAKFYEGENQGIDALERYASIAGAMGGMGGTRVESQSLPWYSGLTGIGQAASGIGGFWGALQP